MLQRTAIMAGTPSKLAAEVPAALVAGGFTIGAGHPAAALLNLDPDTDPDAVIARSEAFAAGSAAPASIVTLIEHRPGWPAARRHACLAAFTRQAALDWAGRGIRVNAITLGTPGPVAWNATDAQAGGVPADPATAADLARVVMAMLNLRSMTGQLVRLGGG